MRYEDHLIEQVQSANDIIDVISQVIPLKKAGRNFKACCPFHDEKTPSFMVQPEKQIFHCFGCGVGGNVFSFLMKYENLQFPEALRMLAEKAHIELPQYKRNAPGKEEGPSLQEKLYDVYKHASDYYHRRFMQEETGKRAQAYFLKRGFDLELAKELQIGWAPPGWQGLFEYLSKKGFSNELLLQSSLIQKASSGKLYDTFRERLLFPISNLSGKVVAFGGRLMTAEEKGPKYLNSPENPIFRKRKELFGLHLAKRHIDRDFRQILIAEGYFDFLRLYQKGFKSSVATLGTSLTEEHVQILKRFADEAIVVYDGDSAGEAAALRGLEIFLEGDMNVKVIRLPAGFDPDDFLMKHSEDEFRGLLDKAEDFFDFKLGVMFRKYDHRDSLGLMKITNEFMETFLKVKNPILVDRYLRKLSGSIGIDHQSLKNEFMKLKRKSEGHQVAKSNRERGTSPQKPEAAVDLKQDLSLEAILFMLMAEDAALLEKGVRLFESSDFELPWAKALFEAYRQAYEAGRPLKSAAVFNRISSEALRNEMTAVLAMDWNDEDRQKAFEDCLQTRRKRKSQGRLDSLRREIARAEKQGDLSQMQAFVKEYQALLQGENKRGA